MFPFDDGCPKPFNLTHKVSMELMHPTQLRELSHTAKLKLLHSDESLEALVNSGDIALDEVYETDTPMDVMSYIQSKHKS